MKYQHAPEQVDLQVFQVYAAWSMGYEMSVSVDIWL